MLKIVVFSQNFSRGPTTQKNRNVTVYKYFLAKTCPSFLGFRLNETPEYKARFFSDDDSHVLNCMREL